MTIRTAQRLPLVQFEVDRDHEARMRPNLVDELWADAATRVLPLWNGSAPIDDAARLQLLPPGRLRRPELVVYLGRTLTATSDTPAGSAVLTAVLDDASAAALELRWTEYRPVALQLSARDTGLFIEALAIANWHRNHAFSPRSGEPTEIARAGWVRVDPGNAQHFPRTDPAVIVAVTDADDRLLLGSNAMWANNRYSLLAGFVEPGESLEDAVVREVFEESGVRVTDPQYLGSQSWPFPASLMLGFTARVDQTWSGDTRPDGEEILDLRWFSRDELREALHQVLLPGPASISRLLIEHWYGSQLDDGSRG